MKAIVRVKHHSTGWKHWSSRCTEHGHLDYANSYDEASDAAAEHAFRNEGCQYEARQVKA